MTPQSNFMIVATIAEGQIDNLRSLLATMNENVGRVNPENNLVPFAHFDGLHFARFMIIEANTADEIKAFGVMPRVWKPKLAFIGDVDGDRDSFFNEISELASTGLKEIFSFCEGFSKEEDLMEWMKKQNVEPAANYVNWIGRTVKQIHEEAALHKNLSSCINKIVDEVGKDDTLAIRQNILSHVEFEKHEGRLTLSPPEPTPCKWKIRNWVHMLGIPIVLLLLSPIFLLFSPYIILRIWMLERSNPELFIRPTREHIENLSAQEDLDASNQFNVFGDVKPGVFPLFLFKFILLLTDYLTRHVFNRGFLVRIKTIHFARWVFIDNNRRAFFASNYDGSHESYMDDFINKAGFGLNLTFGNSVGYPTTQWLIKKGAYQERHFKYTQRRHQLPSEVWYKAYPDLTATDLARNSRIRKGVEVRQANVAEIREWLSLI